MSNSGTKRIVNKNSNTVNESNLASVHSLTQGTFIAHLKKSLAQQQQSHEPASSEQQSAAQTATAPVARIVKKSIPQPEKRATQRTGPVKAGQCAPAAVAKIQLHIESLQRDIQTKMEKKRTRAEKIKATRQRLREYTAQHKSAKGKKYKRTKLEFKQRIKRLQAKQQKTQSKIVTLRAQLKTARLEWSQVKAEESIKALYHNVDIQLETRRKALESQAEIRFEKALQTFIQKWQQNTSASIERKMEQAEELLTRRADASAQKIKARAQAALNKAQSSPRKKKSKA